VTALTTGCVSLSPGHVESVFPGPPASGLPSIRFRFLWTYGVGEVKPGALVSYTATVTVPDDPTPENNTGQVVVTAE